MAFSIYRLEPSDPRSWAFFPIFEKRVLEFVAREGVDADPAMFRADIRGRFFHPQPVSRRLLLFFGDDDRTIGHFYAWVDVSWGRGYVHVNQLDCDKGATLVPLREALFAEMDEWFELLNQGLPETSRIDGCEFWTWHDPEVFSRLLRPGCDLKVSRYVLRYSNSERRAARDSREARARLN